MSDRAPMLQDQIDIIGIDANIIFDVGAHTGNTTLEYLENFANTRVFAFEPEKENFALTEKAVAKYRDRCSLHLAALSDSDGVAQFHVNSHSGTHSLLPIGAQEYWAGPAHEIENVEVPVRTLDSFCAEHSVAAIEILKMDIQGGELAALKGAKNLLTASRIQLLALEVEFRPLYQRQPLFWDVCAYLNDFGYSFFKLYDPYYHWKNKNTLCWADAIFLAPNLTRLS